MCCTHQGVSSSRVEEKKKVGGGDEGWDAGADGCGLEEAAADCRKNSNEEEGKEEERREKRIQCGAAQ